MKPGSRRAAGWGMRGAICLLGLAALAQQSGPPALRKADLVVLVSSSVLRSVNRNEAMASAKVWLDVVARRRGFRVDSRFEVTDSQEDIRKRVEQGTVSMVFLDVMEYLSLPRPELLSPLLTSAAAAFRSYLLVVPSGEASTVEELRGRSVSFYSLSNAYLGRKWLEVVLQERHLGRAERFFGPMIAAAKPSGACLPVFFGKTGACVIDQPSFDLLKEMNPQLGKKLRVILTSPRFLEGIIGMHVNHRTYREEFLQGLMEAHLDPEGRQILTVFRGDRIALVPPERLDAARELRKKYLALVETSGPSHASMGETRPPGSGVGAER